MDTNDRVYTYTGHNDKKRQVPIERVNSLSQLQRGDHIAFPRGNETYWHHAIVEYIDTQKDEIHVIEYSNSAKGFLEDNSSHPKRPGKAKVERGKYKFHGAPVYLIKHKECLDAETVVFRGKSRLEEREYSLITNNCEHFALWCKTDISSSEQVKIVEEKVKKEITKKGLPMAAIGLAAHTASEAGEEIVITAMRKVTKEVVTQTVKKGGQEMVKTSVGVATKQVMTQAVSKGGEEMLKTSVGVATKQVMTQTVSKGGQEMLKTSVGVASKQVATQTVSKGGQEMVKAGVGVAGKQAVAQTVSKGGQEIAKTGVKVASKKVVTQVVSKGGQEIVKTGTRHTTKEVFTHTASKAGEEIVTKGTRVTTKEFVTQTSTKTGSEAGGALLAGVMCAAAFEGASIAYDIYCAGEEMRKGKLSSKEFEKAVGKRVVGGVGSVAGSTAGAAIGQVIIPVPIVGGVVGGVVGGLAGRFFGSKAFF